MTATSPLFIDEGELTFDKSSGVLVQNKGVRCIKKSKELVSSLDLDIDFTKSTQLAQPFSVNMVIETVLHQEVRWS